MMTISTQTTPAMKRTEATLALPTARLVALIAVVVAVFTAGWWAAGKFGPWDAGTIKSGLAGTILTGVIAALGMAVMTPWVARPMSAWITMWLGGTVLRMLLTPVAAYVLYSATSLAAEPLALSVALTYMATLFSEAVVVSLHVKRAL